MLHFAKKTRTCFLLFICLALSLYGCGDEELSQIEEEPNQIQNTVPEPEPICGNNIVEEGEECDDGNELANDGCELCLQLASVCEDCPAGELCVQGACVASLDCAESGCDVDGYFSVHTVDAEGDNIAGVRLTTTSGLEYTSDGHGFVVIDAPELMGREVWLEISKPGYLYGETFFSYRGKTVDMQPGQHVELSLDLDLENPESTSEASDDDTNARMLFTGAPGHEDYFQIHIIDGQTGRGVPLIEVRSPTQTYITDNQGVVAFYELDHMNQEINFEIDSLK